MNDSWKQRVTSALAREHNAYQSMPKSVRRMRAPFSSVLRKEPGLGTSGKHANDTGQILRTLPLLTSISVLI